MLVLLKAAAEQTKSQSRQVDVITIHDTTKSEENTNLETLLIYVQYTALLALVTKAMLWTKSAMYIKLSTIVATPEVSVTEERKRKRQVVLVMNLRGRAPPYESKLPHSFLVLLLNLRLTWMNYGLVCVRNTVLWTPDCNRNLIIIWNWIFYS